MLHLDTVFAASIGKRNLRHSVDKGSITLLLFAANGSARGSAHLIFFILFIYFFNLMRYETEALRWNRQSVQWNNE